MANSQQYSTSPMMQQWAEVRKILPANTLVLWRLGDFYELFEEDALRARKVLGLTLTRRNGTPMAGLPYHALNARVKDLNEHGLGAAIVEGSADKGRKLTEIRNPA